MSLARVHARAAISGLRSASDPARVVQIRFAAPLNPRLNRKGRSGAQSNRLREVG
jgi:hypothetical protein